MKIKDCNVTWQLLEGDEEKEALKRIIEAQQETQRNKGRGKRNILKILDLYLGSINYIYCHFSSAVLSFKYFINGISQCNTSFLIFTKKSKQHCKMCLYSLYFI